MRLFLLLGLALASIAPFTKAINWMKYNLPGGFVDGTIMTLYFWHSGDGDVLFPWPKYSPEPVDVNFYDLPVSEIDVNKAHTYDIKAHIKLYRHKTHPVASNSFVNGKWLEETRREQPLDMRPPSKGWWRVDFIKHDRFRLNVFFNGYWSDVRTFDVPLDNVKSVCIRSDHVTSAHVEVIYKTPNSLLTPMTYQQFRDAISTFSERKLITLPAFSIGSIINMVAVLRASAGSKYRTPSLVFAPVGKSSEAFYKISQIWIGEERTGLDTEKLTLGTIHRDVCFFRAPNGDLQHLKIERISSNVIMMTVFYKPTKGHDWRQINCSYTVSKELVDRMDRPFDILSRDGALIFHIDHQIERAVTKKM